MTIATPPIAARGKFFCGSRSSPAAKLTSCQPSYAQSTATSATPTAASGTGPRGQRRGGGRRRRGGLLRGPGQEEDHGDHDRRGRRP